MYDISIKYRVDRNEEFVMITTHGYDLLSDDPITLTDKVSVQEYLKIAADIIDKDAYYKELFDKLSRHVESKYGYKIEQKDLSELSEAGIAEQTKGMSLFEILGWLGSICLAICGIPQAWQSFKDKHSHGISWGFVLLWAFGEIFALAYVYDKLDLPLVLNYATNILILAVILYYKIKPQTPKDDKEVRRFH